MIVRYLLNPGIENRPVSAVTPTSATFNGLLAYTNVSVCAVGVLWGENTNAWAHTNWFNDAAPNAAWTNGTPFSTNITGLTQDKIYYYSFVATNEAGRAEAAPPVSFITGEITIEATDSTAREKGSARTGTFTVMRSEAVTNLPCTVFYTISGTAGNGVDYVWLPGSAIIPAGETSAAITVTPYGDDVDDPDETVILTLAAGAYAIGASDSATVTIEDVPSGVVTSAAAGNWSQEATWGTQGLPGGGDTVVVNHNITLDASTLDLAALTNNATLTFSGWETQLRAARVVVNGTITHTNNTATNTTGGVWVPNARVWIVCDTLTVASAGKIDTSWKGYAGGASGVAGKGPGGGSTQISGVGGRGGGHGGRSGMAAGLYGQTYGSLTDPEDPGSGGGDVGGGAGGGAIRIEAVDVVTVHGGILADGRAYTTYGGGGGSGGSIYIQCQTLAGTGGVLSAVGASGSGGGGRIAVIYNATEQSNAPLPAVKITADGGWWGNYPDDKRGDVGTLYFPDSQFLTRTNLIAHCGQWLTPGVFDQWTADSLTLSNATLRFNTEGFRLTVNGNLSVVGTEGTLDIQRHPQLQLSNGVVSCGGDFLMNKAEVRLHAGASTGPSFACGGNFTLTNLARIFVYCAPTNGVAPDYGAWVGVTGRMTLASTSRVLPYSHPTNGGSPVFHVNDLFVDATSAFDASYKGFPGGSVGANGKGPGGGTGSAGGAGHGGRSGMASGQYGQTYGSPSAPKDAGSGGGSSSGGGTGGTGGGVIRIAAASAVTVNGSLLADGQTYPVYGGGGGSGGSIYIQCQTLAGTGGVLSAVGGAGSGGGGRIAVIFDSAAQSNAPLPAVKFTTAGGWWGNYPDDKRGDVGTLYFPDSQFLTRTNLIVHSGQWLAPDLADAWTAESLILSNTWLRFNTEGYRLAVNGNLSIFGTDGTLHMLQLSNGVAWCGGDLLMNNASLRLFAGATSGPSLACGGALTLTNNAWLYVYSAPTNGVAPDYGAMVSVTGLMTVASGSWVFPYSHATNGGSPLFRLNHLSIGTNAGFNANDKGYSGRASVGFGPGGGNSGSPGGGGGYGGFGGKAAFPYGQIYGSTNAPLSPGSGGGGTGGAGGGLVRIEAAGSIELKGSILAKGQGFTGYMNTSGSGGGIFVMCQEFASVNGVINADGGTGNSAGSGGGGGRIAVWHGVPESERARILAGNMRRVIVTNAWAGCTATATNGLYGTPAATAGTVVFLTVKKNPGTLIIVR